MKALALFIIGAGFFVGVFLFASPLPAHAAISFAQSTSTFFSSITPTCPMTFPQNVSSGDMLAVTMRLGDDVHDGVTTTIYDTLGNIWSLAVYGDQTVDNDGAIIYYALNSFGGADTVTVSSSETGVTCGIAVSEWKGIATSSALDQTNIYNSLSATANTLQTGSVNTTQSSELALGLMVHTTSGNLNYTNESGWTPLESPSTKGFASANLGYAEYQILASATSSLNATATVSGSPALNAGAIATFSSSPVSPIQGFNHRQGAQTSIFAANASSISCTFNSTPAASDLILVGLTWLDSVHQSSTMTVSDGNNNSYIQVSGSPKADASLLAGASYLFYLIAPSNASSTITATAGTNIGNGANKGLDMWCDDFAVPTGGVVSFDNSSSSSGQSLNITTPSARVSGSNELAYVMASNLADQVSTVNSPWLWGGGRSSSQDGPASAYIQSISTSTAVNLTNNSSTDHWTDMVATFSVATSSPTNVSGYAWGETTGWISFSSNFGGLEVITTTITGYAWSQNFGWINFGPLPSSTGVLNDGNGNLSGYAWSQGTGYINFKGVTIDSSGVFHGIASGTVAGRIQFDSSTGCTYCNVTTTWLPSASVPLSVSSVNINGNNPASITLTPNTKTNVNVNATIADNTCSQITAGTTTVLLYRSGITSSTCLTTPNNLNCYQLSAFTASSTCSSGSVNTTTTFNLQYFAQATDGSSSFPNQNWLATVIFRDSSAATSSADSTHSTSSNILATLTALNVTTSSINYSSVAANSNTGSTNQTTTIQNAGNSSTTLQLSGTALVNGVKTIATSSQHYATSTFAFGGNEQSLQSAATAVSGFLLTSPTSTTNVQSTIFWGLSVPNQTATGTYSGTNTFTAVFSN